MRKVLVKINEFNQNQWLVVSIFTTTSGIWFSFILNFFGNALHFTKINESGRSSLTILGLILTIITIGWSLISLISQRYCDYHNKNLGISQENLGNTETVYSSLNSSTTSIIEKGVLEKLTYIEGLLNNKDKVECLRPIKKPCNTLINITDDMVTVLSKLLTYKKYNIKEKDLHVNIYYNFPLEDDQKWYKTHSSKQERGLKIEELLKPNTAFFEALHSPTHYVYYNDKNVAKKQNHYVPDSEDDSNLNGSIACFLYDIGKGEKTFIRFIITLATYGKKFSKTDSEQENDNIALNLKRCVFPEYEMLIKSALADLYITHLLQ